MRYHVTGPPVRPTAGSGRWEFPVEWRAYAATGEGCTGAVGVATVLSADEAAPTVVSTAEIASPVRQGPFLIAPMGWEGEIERATPHPKPAASGPSGASESGQRRAIADYFADNIEDARTLFPYWRDPDLPADWSFTGAVQDPTGVNGPPDGYCAGYQNGRGYIGVEICAGYMRLRPHYEPVWRRDGAEIYELFMMDNAPAFVAYSPRGAAHDDALGIRVFVFDTESGVAYSVRGFDPILRGADTDAAIAIARSLLTPSSAP